MPSAKLGFEALVDVGIVVLAVIGCLKMDKLILALTLWSWYRKV